MRRLSPLLLLGLAFPTRSIAQTPCSPVPLAQAARAVAAVRHELHEAAVAENDPGVPAAVAANLAQLKDTLNTAAQAAFACAEPSASPEELEKTLADALHANLATGNETIIETRGKKDFGVYGSDLAVQVFPLFNSPRYVEVNFRYGIECGDDNLLLVFKAASPNDAHSSTTGAWQEVLRWGAPGYTNVGNAFGDFIMMTPLSGFPGERNWRFVVAHGQPGCGASNSPSRFDLDVLEPGTDPAQPYVVWHLEHPYVRSELPRLSTTEDTLTFELRPPEKATKTAKAPAGTDTFRYRIGKDNQVEPLSAAVPSAAPQTQASTSSPR